MELKAYAKINLSLDITGVREDGYHLLDTVMQEIDLSDRITLTERNTPGITLRTNLSYLPNNEKNTAYQAAKLFFEACGLPNAGVEIQIEKTVPSRAGMGGGSADAAAVLCGLNQMFSAGLEQEQLMELGAKIGADVPFCIVGGACRCTGIGEICQPVTPLPDCFLVICKPPAGMSTPRAYAMIDEQPPTRTQDTPRVLDALESGDLRQIGKALSNRFDSAMRLMQVRNIKRQMVSCGATGAMMTGSGSAVYGLFATQKAAESCASVLQSHGEVFVCTPRKRS